MSKRRFKRAGFIKKKGRAPFRRPIINLDRPDRGGLTWRMKRDEEYPRLKGIYWSPDTCNLYIMAFERALECGGWRAEEFVTFTEAHFSQMPLELLTTIVDRLNPIIRRSNGRKMPNGAYFEWYRLNENMRRILYEY